MLPTFATPVLLTGLLALPLCVDVSAGQSYNACLDQHCPNHRDFATKWPSYFKTDPDRMIDFICGDKQVRDYIDCVCTNCGSFPEFQGWTAVQAGLCEVQCNSHG